MQRGSAFGNTDPYRSTVVRFKLAYSAFLLGAAVLAAHLFLLQFNPPVRDYYISKIDDRWHSFECPQGRRGCIYFRDGTLLAGNHKVARVIVEPGLVSDLASTSASLGQILNKDPQEIAEKINGYSGRALNLAESISVADALKIDRVGMQGVFTRYYYERFYPHGEYCASATVGYAGRQKELRIGLEKFFDASLTGTDGKVVFRKDSNRQRLPGSVLETTPRKDGADITTTLHPGIQTICEDELRRACDKNRAEWACTIVMDPRNGEILGASTYPSFDPNEYVKGNIGAERNVLVHASVEPGSTAKPLLVAYALDQGWLRKDETFVCNRLLTINGYTVKEAELSHVLADTPGASIERIITQSSNIGMARIALSLGQQKVADSFSAMGFFTPTGLELPGERKGRKPAEKKWPRITLATTGFGQGFTATPVQLAAAYCVIANGGYRVQPHLTKTDEAVPEERSIEELNSVPKGEVLIGAGSALPLGLLDSGLAGGLGRTGEDAGQGAAAPAAGQPAVRQRVLSEETCKLMNKWLMEVITAGTGKKAKLELYSAAGKTGTAEIAGSKGYSKGSYVASFIGYFPAESPRYLVLCLFAKPRGAYYGGQVAAPVFKAIGDRISYLDQLDQARSADTEVAVASRRAD